MTALLGSGRRGLTPCRRPAPPTPQDLDCQSACHLQTKAPRLPSRSRGAGRRVRLSFPGGPLRALRPPVAVAARCYLRQHWTTTSRGPASYPRSAPPGRIARSATWRIGWNTLSVSQVRLLLGSAYQRNYPNPPAPGRKAPRTAPPSAVGAPGGARAGLGGRPRPRRALRGA